MLPCFHASTLFLKVTHARRLEDFAGTVRLLGQLSLRSVREDEALPDV